MRKSFILLGIICLLFTWSCQKEALAPSPEIVDESQFLQLNTLEDLEAFDKMVASEAVATSRGLRTGKIVRLRANSRNELQAAIQAAGRFGLVILEKGNHYEDETVLIEQSVYILGRSGAQLISNVRLVDEIGVVQPAIHVNNTTRVTIWGVQLEARADGGGTGILVENSTNTVIARSTLNNFQAGIMLEQGDQTTMWRNNISITPRGLSDNLALAFGITVINGDDARIIGNKITGGVFGIWACDRNGVAQNNEAYGNLIGLILCNVPLSIPLASGVTGSQEPGNNWLARDNFAHDNFDVGYLVIDGANNNTLIDNQGGNNARVDMELTMDTERFGFLTPRSFENNVVAGKFPNLTIKDCGTDNVINGGVQIDTSVDACF